MSDYAAVLIVDCVKYNLCPTLIVCAVLIAMADYLGAQMMSRD